MTDYRNLAVIYSAVDTPGKRDSSAVFEPEARAFQALHHVPDSNMLGFKDWDSARKRDAVIRHLDACGPLDGVAFFCHGWPHGIQAGFTLRESLELAAAMASQARGAPCFRVALYCCLTAENDVRDSDIRQIGPATKGGFAETLAYRIGAWNIKGHVDAHKTSGHATYNPYVVRFVIDAGERRGAWLVEPKSELWRPWVRALRASKTLRFEYPFLTEAELKYLRLELRK